MLIIVFLVFVSEIVITTSQISVIDKDPDDNRIIEAAIDGNADYIVSGDKDLLRLQKFRNIKIVPAAAFLRVISR